MNRKHIKLLSKYRNLSYISRHDLALVKHLESIGLIEIDNLYNMNIRGILIYYAKITKLGEEVLKQNVWYKRFPIIKRFFK